MGAVFLGDPPHCFADILGFENVAVMQDERQVLLEGLLAEAELQAEGPQRSPGGLQLPLSRESGSIQDSFYCNIAAGASARSTRRWSFERRSLS